MCFGPHQNQGWGWRRETGLSPPVKYFTDRSKAVLLLWIFYVFVLSCVCYVLCASVYMCFVVTCWERADLLALVCGVFCEFVTFPLVSWVRCGTWLYRFLIFATLLFCNVTTCNKQSALSFPKTALSIFHIWRAITEGDNNVKRVYCPPGLRIQNISETKS